MSILSEIEKKSLEAHVELCAERYQNLDEKLDTLEQRVGELEKKLEAKMEGMESSLDEIKSMIAEMKDQRNNQLIKWGIGIITTLLSLVGFLGWHLLYK